jgi:hypothetical protein
VKNNNNIKNINKFVSITLSHLFKYLLLFFFLSNIKLNKIHLQTVLYLSIKNLEGICKDKSLIKIVFNKGDTPF